MPTILISIALLVIVFFAIRSIVKSRGSCSGGCSGCNACGTHTAGPNGEAVAGCSSCNHCGASGQK